MVAHWMLGIADGCLLKHVSCLGAHVPALHQRLHQRLRVIA